MFNVQHLSAGLLQSYPLKSAMPPESLFPSPKCLLLNHSPLTFNKPQTSNLHICSFSHFDHFFSRLHKPCPGICSFFVSRSADIYPDFISFLIRFDQKEESLPGNKKVSKAIKSLHRDQTPFS